MREESFLFLYGLDALLFETGILDVEQLLGQPVGLRQPPIQTPANERPRRGLRNGEPSRDLDRREPIETKLERLDLALGRSGPTTNRRPVWSWQCGSLPYL